MYLCICMCVFKFFNSGNILLLVLFWLKTSNDDLYDFLKAWLSRDLWWRVDFFFFLIHTHPVASSCSGFNKQSAPFKWTLTSIVIVIIWLLLLFCCLLIVDNRHAVLQVVISAKKKILNRFGIDLLAFSVFSFRFSVFFFFIVVGILRRWLQNLCKRIQIIEFFIIFDILLSCS